MRVMCMCGMSTEGVQVCFKCVEVLSARSCVFVCVCDFYIKIVSLTWRPMPITCLWYRVEWSKINLFRLLHVCSGMPACVYACLSARLPACLPAHLTISSGRGAATGALL